MSAVDVGRPPLGAPTHEGGSRHSSLGGVGSHTPPATPKKVGGKMLAVKILMLDDTYTLFQIQSKALGVVLLEQTCRQLSLLESDYFGLEYTDGSTRYWLDLDKPINRQVCLSQTEPVLRFCVKFYPPDAAQLEEEYTRYMFALQIKRDLCHGELHCNENTAALMASYIVQAECGDYVEEDYPDHRYLSMFKFIPSQNENFERKIMDSHKRHTGMSPGAADSNLLETARRCELYGIKMHAAKDHDGVVLNVAVAHMGILVFQNSTKINTFSWAKIRKISFKRKRLLIKLHQEGYGCYKDVVDFFFDGRNECKNFWKKCVEHHGFFRCSTVKKLPRLKTRVLSRGSSFRYSGRTQKQIQDYIRDNYIKRQPFQRSHSFRHAPATPASLPSAGMSVSSHPLIPLRDNQCVGTPASLSCGSMTVASSEFRSSTTPGPLDRSEGFDRRLLESSNQANSRQDSLSPESSSMMGTSPQYRRGHNDSPQTPPSSLPKNQMLGTPTPFTQSQHRMGLRSPSSPKYVATPQIPGENGASSPVRKVLAPIPPDKVPTPNHQPLENGHDVSPTRSGPLLTNGHDSTIFSPKPPVVTTGTKYPSVVTMGTKSPAVTMGINSPAVANNDVSGLVEGKRRKGPMDRSYFIVKELVATERTYKRDLQVLTVWFRDSMNRRSLLTSDSVFRELLDFVDPIYEFHRDFVKDGENCLNIWDSRSPAGNNDDAPYISGLFEKILFHLKLYEDYCSQHVSIIKSLHQELQTNKKFEQFVKDFEAQKICYLPLTAFVLKPLYRIHHYHTLLQRILQHYGPAHPDFKSCLDAKTKLQLYIEKMEPLLETSANLVKLIELQRDLVGIENLVQDGREFVREGSLQKLSRKGYQQRMFFLFNDVLLYTNRTAPPSPQFKVHGQLPLRGVMVEESETAVGAFTIYGGNRALMVAAGGPADKERWLRDLNSTIADARARNDDRFLYLNLKSISSSDEVLNRSDSAAEDDSLTSPSGTSDPSSPTPNRDKAPPTRSNATMHVCWHRATSVSAQDYSAALQNQLSGYLLRKFKNSMGWQKLWVVFSNFCLYFFKTFQDEFPLASLPLLGYSVSSPGPDDQIQKEFVFRLQFKNHVYFFRAESGYTFERWMEVISVATRGAAPHIMSVGDTKENNGES